MVFRYKNWLRGIAVAGMLAAVACSLQLHWFAVQLYGWGTMLSDFAQEESLEVAVEKTFNGENPCQYCESVSENLVVGVDKSADTNSQAGLSLIKLNLLLLSFPLFGFALRQIGSQRSVVVRFASQWIAETPLRPPRG